jgi:phosphatidylglycerol---prolipoprotein diacylglyceryl transferase
LEYPVNIEIGPVEISTHLVCELLAYFLGYRYFLYLRRNTSDTISDENRTIIFIAAAFGALVFSRLIGMLETPDLFTKGALTIHTLYGNKTILGGLLGGLIAVEICKKIIGVTKSSGDLMTYPLLLAMIIGRIGCHLAGLEDGTFGIATTLPWGIDFGDHVTRHPTNLYEIIFLGMLWISLFLIEKKTALADGLRFKIFLYSYCIFRLLVEFIKPNYSLALGLSAIQWASLLGILYYTYLFLTSKGSDKNSTHAGKKLYLL